MKWLVKACVVELYYCLFIAILQISKKYVSKAMAQEIHDKAAPFITWLAEAEEEESSDDDNEVEVSVQSHTLVTAVYKLFAVLRLQLV